MVASPDVSLFKPYSAGIAAENKELKSPYLMITPHEKLPFLDGELKENPTALGFKGTDADGNAYEGNVFTDNVIKATWLPESSNRLYAPDVRRGERVMIYQYGDADKFYWRPLGLDDHLRKLETIVIAISGTKDEGVAELNPENCYFIEFSTHTKRITLQTSKADGEAVSYKAQFDAVLGQFTLNDDLENEFFMDGVNGYLKLVNTQKSLIELDKENIRFTAPKAVNLKAGTLFQVDVGGGASVFTMTPGGTTLKTPKFDGGS